MDWCLLSMTSGLMWHCYLWSSREQPSAVGVGLLHTRPEAINDSPNTTECKLWFMNQLSWVLPAAAVTEVSALLKSPTKKSSKHTKHRFPGLLPPDNIMATFQYKRFRSMFLVKLTGTEVGLKHDEKAENSCTTTRLSLPLELHLVLKFKFKRNNIILNYLSTYMFAFFQPKWVHYDSQIDGLRC